MDPTCDPTAERIAEGLGFSCRHAHPIVTFRDPFSLSSGTMPVLELLIVGGAVFALCHAWRRWRRGGDPVSLTLWFASVAYLAVIEPPLYFPGWFGLDKQVGFIFSHNVFTVQFMYDRLPLYIVAFYPALSQLAYELVRTLGVFARRGAFAGALAVAFVCQVFYEIFDQLGPQLRWWAWNPDNTKVNRPSLASVPMNSMFLFASVSFAGLVYLVVRLAGAGTGKGAENRAGARTGPGIVWRSVVAGILAPAAMSIAGAPAGLFQGHGHLAVQRTVIGVELALVWIVGLGLMADAWRAPHTDPPPSPLFAHAYPPIYLGVLVALWLIALPAYFAAHDGVTEQGTPIGSLWYSTLCAAAAAGIIVAAWRATSSRQARTTMSAPMSDPVKS
ncbi:hypothetical protein [Catenulispora subtropica]|uniref:Integral membrane protein n=1 Tax=Catenulispora subtropica TaxID=450798 RepID=A0ABN2RXA6_9ACTN